MNGTASLNPSNTPDFFKTAFDDIGQDVMVPNFKAPQLAKSYRKLGALIQPASVAIPRAAGSQSVLALNFATIAMRALARGRLKQSLEKFKKSQDRFMEAETQINNTIDGYRTAMRKNGGNRDALALELQQMAKQFEDNPLQKALQGAPADRAGKDRLNELSMFKEEMQFKRAKLQLDYIKAMMDARKMLQPATNNDIMNLDRINQDRALSGLEPMKLEEYFHVVKGSGGGGQSPTSVREFERYQQDPGYKAFYNEFKGKPEATSLIKEYEYYKNQGGDLDFMGYVKEKGASRQDPFSAFMAAFFDKEKEKQPGNVFVQPKGEAAKGEEAGDPETREGIIADIRNKIYTPAEMRERLKESGIDPSLYEDAFQEAEKSRPTTAGTQVGNRKSPQTTDDKGRDLAWVDRITQSTNPKATYEALKKEFYRTGNPALDPSLYIDLFPSDAYTKSGKIERITLPAGVE